MKQPFKVRGLRWYIAVMLCFASELNYFDRQTLSVLAQTIQDELHLTNVDYAQITTAFLASYTVMYAVSGRLVDLLGTRWSMLTFVTGWSIANMLHAFARTALQFSVVRFLLGATEPASFPAGVRAVAEWFPLKERALAIGIFNGGTAVGAALAAPLVSWIALSWGWRWAFVTGGVLGLVWVVVWGLVYRLPQHHRWLGAEEKALIAADQKAGGDDEADGAPVPIRQLLKIREVWGCLAVRMLLDPISYFFIFWTPKFLQQERGFDLADIGKYSGIPFVALAVGNIVGGLVPRYLVGRNWTLNRARKTVIFAVSCLTPVCCLLITRVATPALAITLISVVMFGHAAWGFMALPAEIFPKRVVGTVTGLAGTLGGVAGIITQQMIGWTVQHVSFTPVFTVCAVMHLTAFGAMCWLVGEVGRIREMPRAT